MSDRIPRIWAGADVWIIGGGASIVSEFDIPQNIEKAVRQGDEKLSAFSPYLHPIHNKHIIGVNMAFQLGAFVDILFLGDFSFFNQNRKDISQFRGLKASCHKRFAGKEFKDENVYHYGRIRDDGLSMKKGKVVWHGNSGAASINLASHLGAKRIFLLGFDMDLSSEGFQHWHNAYTLPGEAGRKKKIKKIKKKRLPFSRHLTGFPSIKKAANRLEIEILNVSPNSKIEVFEKITLKEALKR